MAFLALASFTHAVLNSPGLVPGQALVLGVSLQPET